MKCHRWCIPVCYMCATIHDRIVEQILYFSRLGAAHKDYYFEPLPILETCKEAVEDNLSLLEEAHFQSHILEINCTAISDKKRLHVYLGADYQ